MWSEDTTAPRRASTGGTAAGAPQDRSVPERTASAARSAQPMRSTTPAPWPWSASERHTRTEDGLDLPYLVWRLPGRRAGWSRRPCSAAASGPGRGSSTPRCGPATTGSTRSTTCSSWPTAVGLTGDGRRAAHRGRRRRLASAVATATSRSTPPSASGCRPGRRPAGVADAVYPPEQVYTPGTINIVAFMPRAADRRGARQPGRHRHRGQDAGPARPGVPGTGTATDAVCIVCPPTVDGDRLDLAALEPVRRTALAERGGPGPGRARGRPARHGRRLARPASATATGTRRRRARRPTSPARSRA